MTEFFNIVMHNKDDHGINFSFIADSHGKWWLSPAYDLTFNYGMNNEHTTAINCAGNPTKKDIAAMAKSHSVSNWENILNDVLDAASRFSEYAENNKVTKPQIQKIKKSLDTVRQMLK